MPGPSFCRENILSSGNPYPWSTGSDLLFELLQDNFVGLSSFSSLT